MSPKQTKNFSKIYSFFSGAILATLSILTFRNFENEKIPADSGNIEVLFTCPKAFREMGFIEVEKKLIQLVNSSKESIYIQSYSFTSANLVGALIRAFKRGVDVQLLLDKENEIKPSPALIQLINNKIPVKISRLSGIAHSKIMIVDKRIVQTGSFNYTRNANERNAENVLILYDNPKVVQAYLKNWNRSNKNGAYPWSGQEGARSWMDKPDFIPKNMQSKGIPEVEDDRNDKKEKRKWKEEKRKWKDDEGRTIEGKILKATKSIYVNSQLGVDQSIADALLEARDRGVEVKILTSDLPREFQKIMNYLINKGIEVKKLKKVDLKLKTKILIDQDTLIVINEIGQSGINSINYSAFNTVSTTYGNTLPGSFLAKWKKEWDKATKK